MVDAAYVAWRADCAAGRASILVTESARDVRALNERAERAEAPVYDVTWRRPSGPTRRGSRSP